MTVFANSLEVSCKAQGNKIIAATPDTCMTPPENPATPPGVPVPYPSFGTDSDTENGTGTVLIGGETVSQKNISYYGKTTGTEAGSAAKKGVITSTNTGKAYAAAWSNDVKAESEPVVRFSDRATVNHASSTPNDGNGVLVGGANPPPPPPDPPEACPCCDAEPPHANQVDANGALLPQINEADYYERGYNARRPNLVNDVANMEAAIERLQRQLNAVTVRNPAIVPVVQNNMNLSQQELTARQDALQQFDDNYNRLTNARNEVPPCQNLHDPADEGCGVHFNRTGAPPMPEPQDLGYTEEFGQEFKRQWDMAHGTNVSTLGGGHQNRNNHMTPLNAGGCPTGSGNLIPHQALPVECQALDDIQSDLQG